MFNDPKGRYARLPAAYREIHQIAALVGGRTSLFSGSDAVKSNLRRALSKHFPLMHFATHAFSDPEDPARSFILMASANPAAAWDYLFLDEVSSLDLRGVDLVTLSSCETEAGKLVEGEGVSGFSRAFLGAGADAVVSSLWKVGDQSTADLMRIFYRELSDGATAADALRIAKSEFASRQHAHPFYWAAFVLNGDAGMQIPRVIPWTFAAAGVLAFGGCFLLLWNGRKRAALKKTG